MKTTTRTAAIAALVISLLLAAPLSAVAAWPTEPTLEKYSIADGTRQFSRGYDFERYGHMIFVDAAGYIYQGTVDGYDVIRQDGTVLRRVDIRGASGVGDIVVAPNGYVYVTAPASHQVQCYTRTGRFVRSWGGYGATKGRFKSPYKIACDSKSNLFVTDDTNRIQKFTYRGSYVTAFGGKGARAGQFPGRIGGIDVSPVSGMVYTVEAPYEEGDASPRRVQRFTNGGSYRGAWAVWGSEIAIDRAGYIYIASQGGNPGPVSKYNVFGRRLRVFEGATPYGEGGYGSPWGLAVDRWGNFYVTMFAAG